MIRADFEKTHLGWRDVARRFLQDSIPPQEINWGEASPTLLDLIAGEAKVRPALGPRLTVPAEFLKLVEALAYARDETRWELLYRILYRLQFENENLLKVVVDPDIHRAYLLNKSVRRDIHKMHAFVRFKKTLVDKEEVYVAWHRPEHLIVKPAAPFFARRFGDKRWSIFTPEESAHWDLKELHFGPGLPQHEFATTDVWDEAWKTYYKSIFNPARINIHAMKLEMATKYWSSMPETALIRELVREAPQRLQKMSLGHNRAALVNAESTLLQLREAARSCTACSLCTRATQTVFGEGNENAEIMIVGEQPGDSEDLAGKPFVGPAGALLDQALVVAQLRRAELYITNAVKHFKWAPRGKIRVHQKPSGAEMHACKPWLDAEIARVKPKVIVALGTTAATAILGRLPKISAERGKILANHASGPAVVISWHPSAILRAASEAEADTKRAELAQDLALAKTLLREVARLRDL